MLHSTNERLLIPQTAHLYYTSYSLLLKQVEECYTCTGMYYSSTSSFGWCLGDRLHCTGWLVNSAIFNPVELIKLKRCQME